MGFTIKTNRPTQITMGGYTRYPLSNGRYQWYDSQGKPLTKEIGVNDWILKPDGTRVRTAVRRANRQAAIQAAKTQPITSIPSSIAFAPWNQEPYMDQEKEIVNPAVISTTEQQSDTTTTKTGKINKTAIRSKIAPKGQAYWDSQYKNFLSKMTDDQKKWLDQRGIDYSSAEQLQGYLSRLNKNIDQSFVDNKWGKNSQAAWEDFVNTTMKNNPLQTSVKEPEPILDQPDPFGYKTSNIYENDDFANKVKALGIRSNADLINFMHNSGKEGWQGDEWLTQFRSDVDRALGGDYSDANIRRVFNTQGNWGRGFMGRGDFGDFQNALQTNAGVWNGIHDAKKTISTTKPTLNTQEMLNNVKSLKFTTPEWKFSLNQGNIGASTLGDLPSTRSESNNLDWMKYAQQTGYLPTE